MRIDRIRFLAARAGVEVFWLRESQVWAVKRKSATSVEATGGRFIAPKPLYALSFDQLTSMIRQAAEGPREAGE